MTTIAWYGLEALGEIAGCFAVWAWLRLDRSPLWLIPAALCLAIFAWALTRVESDYAGRAFAAYGGVYVAASLVWMAVVERAMPDRWDLIGTSVMLIGAGIVIWAPRIATG